MNNHLRAAVCMVCCSWGCGEQQISLGDRQLCSVFETAAVDRASDLRVDALHASEDSVQVIWGGDALRFVGTLELDGAVRSTRSLGSRASFSRSDLVPFGERWRLVWQNHDRRGEWSIFDGVVDPESTEAEVEGAEALSDRGVGGAFEPRMVRGNDGVAIAWRQAGQVTLRRIDDDGTDFGNLSYTHRGGEVSVLGVLAYDEGYSALFLRNDELMLMRVVGTEVQAYSLMERGVLWADAVVSSGVLQVALARARAVELARIDLQSHRVLDTQTLLGTDSAPTVLRMAQDANTLGVVFGLDSGEAHWVRVDEEGIVRSAFVIDENVDPRFMELSVTSGTWITAYNRGDELKVRGLCAP
ncbi:MAG: hypothetical protein AAFQ82_17260 [Myxococcota bacterium]